LYFDKLLYFFSFHLFGFGLRAGRAVWGGDSPQPQHQPQPQPQPQFRKKMKTS